MFACLRDTLDQEGVKAFYLSEGEADGFCVSLARELGAFVLGNDSDFAILGATGREGYKGYVPIDSLQWVVESKLGGPENTGDGIGIKQDEDDGFSTVKKTSRRKPPSSLSYHLLPPPTFFTSPTTTSLTLILLSYPPSLLASRLRIPPTHLPLLASLIGTDHSPEYAEKLFFSQKEGKGERIERVGRVLRESLVSAAVSGKANGKKTLVKSTSYGTGFSSSSSSSTTTTGRSTPTPTSDPVAGDQAYSFISQVISNLITTNHQSSHPSYIPKTLPIEQFETLTSEIIEATMSYILPPSPSSLHGSGVSVLGGGCCLNFPFCDCLHTTTTSLPLPLLSTFPEGDRPLIAGSRSAYAKARDLGLLFVLGYVIHPERTYLFGILEDPEGHCLRSLEESKRVRGVAWGVVKREIGGLRSEEVPSAGDVEEDEEGEEETQDGEEEQIDLKGEGDEEVARSIIEESEEPNAEVYEYYRSGSTTKIARFPLEVLDRNTSLGLVSQPSTDRHRFFLETMKSDNSKTLALEFEHQPFVAVLRMAIILCAASDRRQQKLWTTKELSRVIKAGIYCAAAWERTRASDHDDGSPVEPDSVTLETRAVNVVSQVVASMQDAVHLAQALHLVGSQDQDEEGALSHGRLYEWFEGTIWHSVLANGITEDMKWSTKQEALHTQCLGAVIEGLENMVLGATQIVKPTTKGTEMQNGIGGKKVVDQPKRKKVVQPAKKVMTRYDILMTQDAWN